MNEEALVDGDKTTLDTEYYNFLKERENKLKEIEKMFKNKSVDLRYLAFLVEGK